MKRFKGRRAAALTACVLLFAALGGCSAPGDASKSTADYVAVCNDVYLMRENYEAWVGELVHFGDVYGKSLCQMLGLGDVELTDATSVLAYVRYSVVTHELGGEADDQSVSEGVDAFFASKRADYKAALLAQSDAVPAEDDASYASFMASLNRQASEALEGWQTETGCDEAAVSACVRVYKTIQLLYTRATADVSLADSDVEDWYARELAVQETCAEEDIALATARYLAGYYPVTLYVPPGMRAVKIIQISFTQAQLDTLATLSGADYAAYYAQCLSQIYARAYALWNGLLYGADFDGMSRTYNTKAAYMTEDGGAKELWLYEGMPGEDFLVLDAFQLAAPGHMSGLVQGAEGYLVMKYIRDVPSGALALEQVYDAASEAALQEKMLQSWYDALDAWVDAANVRYPQYA